jgi:G patch domain-containing protein 1
MGMYGVMTREVCAWQPARLLRKRFGVKDAGLEVPADTSGPEFTGTASADEFIGATQVKGKASRNSKCDATNIGLGEDDGQGMCSHMNVPR